MSIRLEEINARGLGPLDEFSAKMGDINLVYGPNEQGKTFLVEFLLKSLFKNVKEFRLRPGDPSGTVLVSGLGEDLISFSPKARQKLEDYWEKDIHGMPPNIARLLVVKGAELDLDDKTAGGVSKAIIKSFLSSKSKLDFIQDKIQKTIQDASIESGNIIGVNRGDLKKRNEIYAKLKDLDELLSKVDQEFSGGDRAKLKHKIAQLREDMEELQKAKRYRAYTTANQIEKIIKDLNQIEENGLDDLLVDFSKLNRLNDELEGKLEKRTKTQKNSQHYEWLKMAIDEYQRMFERGGIVSNRKLLFLALIAFVFGGLLSIGGMLLSLVIEPLVGVIVSFFGLLGVGLGVLFGFLYIRQHQKSQNALAENEEIKRISISFEEKFETPLRDIATLKTQKERIEKDYFETWSLSEEIEETQKEIKNLTQDIASSLDQFGHREQDEDTWTEIIASLDEENNKLKNEKNELKFALERLSVSPDEYLETNPGVEFFEGKLKKTEEELNLAEGALQQEEYKFKTLDTEIRSTIGDKTSTSWDALLENLRCSRHEVAQTYRALTSQILAGILVNKVVENARLQEDEKIKANLSAQVVTGPLFKITGRYQAISLDEDRIKVNDMFDEFDVDELSTGAREQVLLALRLGFASKIMGQNTAFLILDDAFQHSDWRRRERLIEQTVDLAKNGWQILYFTMDKHIQGLFDDVGKNIPDISYKSFDISKK